MLRQRARRAQSKYVTLVIAKTKLESMKKMMAFRGHYKTISGTNHGKTLSKGGLGQSNG
jgi:hypothetical protein